VGRFRARKRVPIIPGLLRMNASGSAGGGKKASGGVSWTWHLGKLVSYNTKTGVTTVNTPGLGSWSSSTKAQRKARREDKAMWRFADAEYDRQSFQDIQAGRTPDMEGPPSQRGLKSTAAIPQRYRKPRPGAPQKPQPIAYCSRCGARLNGNACPNCPPPQRQGRNHQTGGKCGSRRTTTGSPCQQPVAPGGSCRFHP
jgi:hypothetical protein